MSSRAASPERQTALVTGASMGIGYALAKIFAREGYDLVVVARSQDRLTEVAREFTDAYGVSVKVIPKDLSLPTASQELLEELQREVITVDVLVNNAGFAVHGFFLETDLSSELNMMQVNMVTLTHLTKLLVREMQARGTGKVLNVASTAAFQPGPRMAVYYASKAYVLSFSEALADELRGSGVTITALCPGATRSGYWARAKLEDTRLMRVGKMDPEAVAEIGYRGLMSGRRVVIPGLRNTLLAWAVRFSPKVLVRWIVRMLHATR